MVKIGGKIGTLYQMLKNAFKKHPLQNRTNVQIKGGGGQRPFEQCSKKLHFFETMASLISLREGLKKRIIYGQADHKRTPPPLRSAFCEIFFGCVFYLGL